MEEAWYYALSKGLWAKLGSQGPSQWPNFYRFNKGIVEVWEDKDFISGILDAIWVKKDNVRFFDNLLRDYERLVAQLKNDKLVDSIYLDKLFEAIAIFPIIWYGILDERTEKKLRKKFVDIRYRDTIWDGNDKIVRKRILKKYPTFYGFETTLLKEEFLKSAPKPSILKKRLHNFILVPGEYAAIVDLKKFATSHNIELELPNKPKSHLVRGVVANYGKAVGSVRIIRMKSDVNKMKHGEILISPMTTPDVFPAMRKASAVVTDEGGVLCHAAIMSRELNIPCIIGTKIASELFKDGDRIEVDATQGIVRKL